MEDGLQDQGWPVRVERDAIWAIERPEHVPAIDERGLTPVHR